MTNKTVEVKAGVPTLLTDENVTVVRLFVVGPSSCIIQATNGVSTSVTVDGAVEFKRNQGDEAFDLSVVFPGVAGANRLYGISPVDTKVSISYA